ncbi:MAG: hypothetical protein KIS95_11595 [Anaerolineae bacterium]|uniref:hypothetical protein n=1 Tax=Promineifilum sp. TaxID=2664178 RepID=UPI001D663A3E|nr:hypothetical protein [Anaerolineales bacterium]MCB8935920.1 hypothetical protein [Promineifilum sp.]MCO5180679.1 hypothetical protein [Promineifilum sp.]MCW5847868.1 hypothetical protein [Anaerolineae bacterium]
MPIAALALLFIAGDHPLVEHWGDVASSNVGDFGSKWIHTATSGVRYGLWGESASKDARGVFGSATTTDGSGVAIGVYGQTDSPTGRGVTGYATNGSGANHGVVGATYSTNFYAAGVYGFNNRTSGPTRGTVGLSTSPDGYGVYGEVSREDLYSSGTGVYGLNRAASGDGIGVYGQNLSPEGWGGKYESAGNGVYYYSPTGKVGLVVYNGSKNAAVPTSDGDRLLYSEESTEVWFSDYGFGELRDGQALVTIDPIFAETVNLDEPYHVFLQAYGDAELYVTERTSNSFQVVAKEDSSDKNSEFSYRIVGKRNDFENDRLEKAPWVTDEQLYYQPSEPPPATPMLANPVGEE